MATVPAPSPPAQKQTVYLSLDIEKGGNTFDHPLLAVGVCVADFTKGVSKKRTWCCLQRPGQSFELRCIYEFWCKYPEVLRRIDVEGKPLEEQMKSFSEFLHQLDAQFPSEQYNVVLISDNPSFDIEHLDHYFCEITKEVPIRYSRANKYRSVEDPSERLEALDMWKEEGELLKSVPFVNHDHYPENDAEKIFWQHVLAMAAGNLLKKDGMTLAKVKEQLAGLKTNEPEKLADKLLALARGAT
jgi:hypothetical protein